MKKTILILSLIALSFVGKSQCHTYDTLQVNTTNIGGNIDSIQLSSTFYVVLATDTMPFNTKVKSQRTILFKVPSTYTGIQMIGYADLFVYKWVQNNYTNW
jgi:hypothetical protein